MLLDEQNLFSDKQAITASAASTNFINLGAAATPAGGSVALAQDMGGNLSIPLLIQVTTAFATLTSLTVTVQTDDNSSFSSATTVASTHAVPVASLVPGYIFPLTNVPIKTNERYVRLFYTVTGSNATAGAITASIAGGIQTNV